ncbi:MAG: hypothetical protein EGP79_02220 [Roseburia intestinalis]|jgi:hypothetical protein|nr:hypothetical protein [Roseburia intestinalis]
MGCHTWFYRPITEKEFELMKDYAPIEISDLINEDYIKIGGYDKTLYDLLMKSYNENLPCVYGCYWWQLGWGDCNPELNNCHATCYISKLKGLYIEVEEYGDTFRVNNYPTKIIHSRRELRRWMGKKYFNLSQYQLERVSEFFRNNRGGIIKFG